jgi:hypothetical protein
LERRSLGGSAIYVEHRGDYRTAIATGSPINNVPGASVLDVRFAALLDADTVFSLGTGLHESNAGVVREIIASNGAMPDQTTWKFHGAWNSARIVTRDRSWATARQDDGPVFASTSSGPRTVLSPGQRFANDPTGPTVGAAQVWGGASGHRFVGTSTNRPSTPIRAEIFRIDDGVPTVLARTQTTAPWLQDGTRFLALPNRDDGSVWDFPFPRMDSSGRVLFPALLGGGSSGSWYVVVSASPGESLSPLVWNNMPVQGAISTLTPYLRRSGTGTDFYEKPIMEPLAGGEVIVRDQSTRDLYRVRDGIAHRMNLRGATIVRDGQDWTISHVFNVASTLDDQLMAYCRVVRDASAEHIALITDGTEVLIGPRVSSSDTWQARQWDIGSSEGQNNTFGFNSPGRVNSMGQILHPNASPLTSGNMTELHLWTPHLYWRTAGSGSWDDRTNFTVSIRPAYPHDVTLAPAVDATIAGPSVHTEIESLTLGGSAGNVRLNLASGVTFQTLEGVTVTTRGTLAGDATLMGNLTVAAAGTYAFDASDGPLDVLGHTLFDGTLRVELTGAAPPLPGSTLEALTAYAVVGTPTAVNATPFAGLTFEPVVGVDSIELLVGALYAGDADLDADVDFADLLVLAQHYEQTSTTWLAGDFNADGSTDFADLLTLAQNYGAGAPAPSPSGRVESDSALARSLVPEPTVACVLLAGAAMLMRRAA